MALTRTNLAVLATVLASVAACSSPRTEIIVAVDSDLAVPAELDNVSIEITSPSGLSQRSMALLGPTQPALPRTLGLVYEGGAIGPYDVRAIGSRGTSTIVERRARVYFVVEQTVLLRLDLLRSCRGTTCGADMTCASSGCRDVDIEPSELAEWTGSIPPLTRPDGGAPPVDGGRPATDSGPCRTEICNGMDDDCDGMTDDGFDLMTDVLHCGDCGNVCTPARAVPSCAGGMCGVESCNTGWGNCDGLGSNGCETDTQTSRTNCGMCGDPCSGSNVCCAGTCRPRGSC